MRPGLPFKNKAENYKNSAQNRRELPEKTTKHLRNEKKLFQYETFCVLNFVIRAKVYTFTADIITIPYPWNRYTQNIH